MSLPEIERNGPSVEYPRFEHGEDLLILLRGDGKIEFRSDSAGEFVKADNAVTVSDVI